MSENNNSNQPDSTREDYVEETVALDRFSIKPPSKKTPIGAAVISLLGILFGMILTMAGSIVYWKVDPIFHRFSKSGFAARGFIAGDGKIMLVLAIVGFAALVAGGILRRKWLYGIALVASLLILGLATYEIVHIALSTSIYETGSGLYMCVGGGVAGSFCSLGGVTMV